MIENREVWLEALMRVEGGFANNKADPGGATRFGITIATLSDWRGEKCNVEDVAALDEEEAKSIMIAKYWQVMRGDQLPSGLDCYAADFAVNSGPARAARVLQELVDTKADSFIGPKTIEAVRKRKPLDLLLAYHDARMQFLLGLETWDTFGRGWTNRCREMLALAKARLQARPAASEAAGSTIATTATAGGVGSAAAVAWAYDKIGPQVIEWLQAPDSLDKLQTGVAYLGSHGTVAHVLIGLGAMQALCIAGFGFIGWKRLRMWQTGKV